MTPGIIKGVIVGGVLIGTAILSIIGKNSEKEISAKLLVKIKSDLINLFTHCKLPLHGLEELFSSESDINIVLNSVVINIICSFIPVNDNVEVRLSVQYIEGTAEKRSISKRCISWDDLPKSLADQVLKNGIDGTSFQLYSKNNVNES